MKKMISLTILATGIVSASGALADKSPDSSAPAAIQTADIRPASALTEGEVRKVDKDARKITIRHGALENLNMPPMTMVFQVKDSAMLDQLKAGDKIRFLADNSGGAFVVTQLEQVN